MKRSYRAAIVGCGGVASLYDVAVPTSRPLSHAGAYHLHPRVDLVAAVEPDEGRRESFAHKWGVRHLYDSVEGMFEAEGDLDIVSICSPTADHTEHLLLAIRNDVPCALLEKPVASDLEEARRLADAAANAPGIAVNYYRRWSPYFIGFRDAVRVGTHGVPVWCRFLYTKGLVHNGTHFLDLAEWLFGDVVEVRALRWPKFIEDDCAVDASLRFESGFVCYIIAYPTREGQLLNVMEMELVTDRERIRFEKGGRLFQYYAPSADELYEGRTYMEPAGGPVRSGSEASFLKVVENLVSYLDGAEPLKCTLAQGVRPLELAFLILQSARAEGAPVAVRPGEAV